MEEGEKRDGNRARGCVGTGKREGRGEERVGKEGGDEGEGEDSANPKGPWAHLPQFDLKGQGHQSPSSVNIARSRAGYIRQSLFCSVVLTGKWKPPRNSFVIDFGLL